MVNSVDSKIKEFLFQSLDFKTYKNLKTYFEKNKTNVEKNDSNGSHIVAKAEIKVLAGFSWSVPDDYLENLKNDEPPFVFYNLQENNHK